MYSIGILAVQGSFAEHLAKIKAIGHQGIEVRTIKDLEQVESLIIPGGESTVISKLLDITQLRNPIIKRVQAGMPIYGTCAGAILLAKKVTGKNIPETLGLIDIIIERNAYGSQLDSFIENIKINKLNKNIPAVFIRAPVISKIGSGIRVLAYNKQNQPILVQKDNILVSTFHPELTNSELIHQYFSEY